MKSYNQLVEDTHSVFLKEWNALSEETRREILEEIIEANELEVSEEELKEAVATAALTSPLWVPALKTAVAAGGAYLASKGINNMIKNRQNSSSMNNIQWRDKPLPKSSRTDTQRSSSNSKVTTNMTPNGGGNNNNNNNNKNNWKSKLKNFGKKVRDTAVVGGSGYAAGRLGVGSGSGNNKPNIQPGGTWEDVK